MSLIKTCTFNVRGIQDNKKRNDLFAWLKRKHFDLCLLQETHSSEKSNSKWETEWGYKCIFSNNTTNSRGVAILLNNTFCHSINKTIIDPEGRYIILDITINNNRITLVNLYGPNLDQPTFFTTLNTKLAGLDNNNTVIGGDFNVVQNYTIDIQNLKNRNNPNSNEAVNEMKMDLDLYDPWRDENPDTRMYTWHNSRNQLSRLDYFLVSDGIKDKIDNICIKPGYRSDHSVVELTLNFSYQQKGPGLWRFNNSLLTDDIYNTEIRKVIDNVKNLNHNLSDQLLFEFLKSEIRGKTIAYATAKKKEEDKQEKILDKKINMQHKKYNSNANAENLDKLNELQNELKALREKKVEGIITRAKAKWHLEGEKSTKYFCNLENRHYQEKTITKLVDSNGKDLNDINDILNEQKTYYENLYKAKRSNNTKRNLDTFFPDEHTINKLTEDQSLELEHEISEGECLAVLKNMKLNKSPGSDGFTVEFYQHFWSDLKLIMLQSFREAFITGRLSDNQKLGVITCLPKPGKDKAFMKNWRPISLLNVDYKILSGVISNRIKTNLNDLISKQQKGFVAGRNIGECTRITWDLIYKMKKYNMSGLILLIDFEKAFDSLSWNFVNRTLKYFNFGENIRKWVNIFYTDIQSCVINNGHCSERFNLERGVRQGDPLSPYLFILAAEILANSIINNDIKGINIDNSEYLISQLADDTTLFLEHSEQNFRKCINLLERFEEISGLKINFSKTLVIKIRLSEELQYNLGNEKDINWQLEGKFRLLGIKYDLDQEDFTKDNYNEKIQEISKLLNVWIGRKLTIYGKICIIKSLALSKLNHLFTALPNPSDECFKQLESICFKFLWDNKNEKIRRTTLYNIYENGGLRMVNIRYFCMSQKITWIKKLMDDLNFSDWKTLLLSDITKHGGNYIWFCRNQQPNFKQSLNPFWKNVHEAWVALSSRQTENPLLNPIFHNNEIKINKKTIFYNDWYIQGIRYLNDLFDEEGNIYTWEQFSLKYDIHRQAFKYVAVTHAIPKNWKKRIKDGGCKLRDVVDSNVEKVKQLKKPGKYFYNEIVKKLSTRPTKSEDKWQTILDCNLSENNWMEIYNTPHQATRDTKLRLLQYKILHRILPVNSWLFKCGLTNSNTCNFCQIYIETIEHLLWECNVIKNLWLALCQKLNIEIFNMKDAILGISEDFAIEHIKIITKDYIFKCKLYNNTQPNLNNLLHVMKIKIKIEESHTNRVKFLNKWGKYLKQIGID